MDKIYYIATKKDEVPRIAKYSSSLNELSKNGFTISRGLKPKIYWYIVCKRK